MMQAVDGNAIAGELFCHFGTEMTEVSGRCTNCGATGPVGRLLVYRSGPGAVARCQECGAVTIVLVQIRGELRVDTGGYEFSHR
jgi:uncharacterized Zn finger protein